MFKKIVNILGHLLLLSIVGVYLYFLSNIEEEHQKELRCNSITVIIKDSLQNRFVSPQEVIELLEEEGVVELASSLYKLELNELERTINKKRAIKKSEISYTLLGNMVVEVTQRRPIIRVESQEGGFYIDDSGYIFPLVKSFTSYVPIVTGDLPIRVEPDQRGEIKEGEEWLGRLYSLALFLDREPLWNSMVEQLYFDKDGDLYISPRIGSSEVLFGQLTNIEDKFNKLALFYKEIAPHYGWDYYESVNLEFNGQLVCKRVL